eukprot:TRINITY_DN74952_c0_g1_i1.p3 TRINITY_DN74952_c0_g1~~TRINITY_DN74952_c0_g1_i1.p3  ORF type:complete len:574 (-),score=74.00 TRINITY_DN74952_c0_g1_i1:1249-2970(-)
MSHMDAGSLPPPVYSWAASIQMDQAAIGQTVSRSDAHTGDTHDSHGLPDGIGLPAASSGHYAPHHQLPMQVREAPYAGTGKGKSTARMPRPQLGTRQPGPYAGAPLHVPQQVPSVPEQPNMRLSQLTEPDVGQQQENQADGQPTPQGDGTASSSRMPNEPPPPLPIEADDPLMTDIAELLNTFMPDAFNLPITKENFLNEAADPNDSPNFAKQYPALEAILQKKLKKYYNDTQDLYKTVAYLKRDLETLQKGEYPRAYQKPAGVQYKKDIADQFGTFQKKADHTKSTEDFRRRVKSNQLWLQQAQAKLEATTYTKEILNDCYDHLHEKRAVLALQDFSKIKAHVLHVVSLELPRLRNLATEKFQDAQKLKSNKDEDMRIKQERFDELVANHGMIAHAIFMRELEERLLAVIFAEKGKEEEAHKRARRGQELTRLERSVYKMADQLKENKLPHLPSQSTLFWVSRGRSRKRSTSQKKPQNGKGRKDTRKSRSQPTQRSASNRSQRTAASQKASGKPSNSKPIGTHERQPSRSASQASSRGSKGKGKKGKKGGKGGKKGMSSPSNRRPSASRRSN